MVGWVRWRGGGGYEAGPVTRPASSVCSVGRERFPRSVACVMAAARVKSGRVVWF